MSSSSVSIHIVNWNGGADIIKCLESVYAQTYQGIKEVVIVDNGSTDGSVAAIEKKFHDVTILKNGLNMGFCMAHNQAIRMTGGEYVLALNFDILLEPDFLSHMVQAMAAEDRIGMASGKLYRSASGMKTGMLDSTGIMMSQYFPSPRGEGMEDAGQHDTVDRRAIFGPCGAAPLYRRAMLEDIEYGGEYFDEDFVNYVEDVDLAWRAQLRGWKAVYEPAAIAYHERGVTRKANAEEQHNYFLRGFRNRYLCMYKNISHEEWRETRFKIINRELLFLLDPGEGRNTPFVRWGALKEARRSRSIFESKRKYIQSRVTISHRELDAFFEREKFGIFRLLWSLIKHRVHRLLSKSNSGRILIHRYSIIKRKHFPL
jgi:GT2 family glycosyltransferase